MTFWCKVEGYFINITLIHTFIHPVLVHATQAYLSTIPRTRTLVRPRSLSTSNIITNRPLLKSSSNLSLSNPSPLPNNFPLRIQPPAISPPIPSAVAVATTTLPIQREIGAVRERSGRLHLVGRRSPCWWWCCCVVAGKAGSTIHLQPRTRTRNETSLPRPDLHPKPRLRESAQRLRLLVRCRRYDC